MYRLKKSLNHNSVLATKDGTEKEYLILGKGIGFGKKPGDTLQVLPEHNLYSLQASTERGSTKELANSIRPLYLEIANDVLTEAKKVFQTVDENVLFPMADHIAYAVKRIQKHEQMSNPLTNDIRLLFHMEYKVATCIRPILKKKLGIVIGDDEIGYIALHIHSAIQDEKVSQAMQMAKAVHDCISLVEEKVGYPIDVLSLSYNRLMNHVRNMVARALIGEELKLNMNDYMEIKFPWAFETAKTICQEIGQSLHKTLSDAEIGYLAMHVARVAADERDAHNIEKGD